MTRIVAFVLACVGQAALWASPLFACACGPSCAERRAATAASLPGCCAAATNSADSHVGCCCSCSGEHRDRPATRGSEPAPTCAACMSDELGPTRCGPNSGGSEGGSCGCFHGPNFEIASQGAALRSVAPFELPAAFFFPAVTDAARVTIQSGHWAEVGGILPYSSARIQAVLCVWRK